MCSPSGLNSSYCSDKTSPELPNQGPGDMGQRCPQGIPGPLYNPFHSNMHFSQDDDDDDYCSDDLSNKGKLLGCIPFHDEDLKPSPLVRKRKKQMVHDELKDEKYWERRRKNNMAAKRSRDARRAKENQIAIRASFLEHENKSLSEELSKVRAENQLLRERLCKYEVL